MRVEPLNRLFVDDIDDRRRQLQRQRGAYRLRNAVRLIILTACAVGAIAAIRQPRWMLQDSRAIAVSGNQWLPDDTVRALLDLNYPQSLLRLDPEQLAQQLSTSETIAEARVQRELMPPGLNVWVRERQPVAIAYPADAPLVAGSIASIAPSRSPQLDDRLGLLDASGQWMNYTDYINRPKLPPLPTLATRGNYDEYKARWPDVYAALSRSRVQIAQIDWRDPSNVTLSTEIGLVHLGSIGAISSRLPEQITALDRLRHLPQQVGAAHILYIDLSDPRSPYVQMPSP